MIDDMEKEIRSSIAPGHTMWYIKFIAEVIMGRETDWENPVGRRACGKTWAKYILSLSMPDDILISPQFSGEQRNCFIFNSLQMWLREYDTSHWILRIRLPSSLLYRASAWCPDMAATDTKVGGYLVVRMEGMGWPLIKEVGVRLSAIGFSQHEDPKIPLGKKCRQESKNPSFHWT